MFASFFLLKEAFSARVSYEAYISMRPGTEEVRAGVPGYIHKTKKTTVPEVP